MRYGIMIPPGEVIALAEARRRQRQQDDRFLSLPLPDYREPSPGYQITEPDGATADESC